MPVFAQDISTEEATLTAKNFFFERINQNHTVQYNAIRVEKVIPIKKGNTTVYYIANIKPDGWVMVSASKNSIPIPAYSLEANYNDAKQPPQYTAWVKQYADQIEYALAEKPINAKATAEWERLLTNDITSLTYLKKEKSIEPMLLSNWDQGNYFNQMCPDDPAGPSGHCYTGCVATAMGQLCEYFRWPINGTGSYAYEHEDYGTISANFEETNYKWNEMTNELNSPNLAVAELLFHLGVSVDMEYGPDGSGMYNHKAAYSLRTHFKFDQETEYLYRDSTTLNWDSTVLVHLNKGIPMYYAGWSLPNVYGHAFIVDGYQTEEYFHFNWGWGGTQDGYFYLQELNPGGSNFNLAQELIINAYPDSTNYTYPNYETGSDTLHAINGTLSDGSGPLYNYENSMSCSWLIDPQSVYDSVSYITLEFNQLNTEENTDIISIYDGPTTSDALLGVFSGNNIPQLVQSTGNKVLITFESDTENTSEGWFMSYTSETPQWCSGLTNYFDPIDTINDGSGAFYYQNNSTCMWYIQPEAATSITLTFLDFDTEAESDLVKIYNAATNTLLETWSGNEIPTQITVETSKMMISFTSNSTETHQGWTAWYTIDDVSVNSLTKNTLPVRIYPNPTKQLVYLEFNQDMLSVANYSIKSLTGKTLKSGYIPANENKHSIDINDLKPGVYMINIQYEDQFINNKLIINP